MSKAQLNAYREMDLKGVLSKRRFQVYEIIEQNHPIAIFKMVELMRERYTLSTEGSVSGRLSELVAMDLIEVVGEEINPISGVNNTLYRPTYRPMKPLVKTNESKAKQIKKLETEVESLRGMLRGIIRTSKELVIVNKAKSALEQSHAR